MIWFDNLFPWFGYMLDLGGDILLLIIVLAALMWTLLLERFYFLAFVYPLLTNRWLQVWQEREERRSWHAQQHRTHLLFQSNRFLQRNLSLLKTLVKLCPLLGLLGTVLGMLEIFDAVAITGGTNPRATAGGVSKAIITTMAGMVVAISALPILSYLSRYVAAQNERLAEKMPLDG